MIPVSFDVETWRISPGRLAPRIVCASLSYDGQSADLVDRAECVRLLEVLLDNEEIHLIAHNAAFDFGALLSTAPHLAIPIFQAYEDGRIRCTMIRETLYKIALGELQSDPEDGHRRASFSLAKCVERRLGIAMGGKHGDDIWRLRYHELDGVPIDRYPPEASEYAKNDAIVTWNLFHAQNSDCELFEANETEQVKASFALHLKAAWGIRASKERVEALERHLIERVVRAREVLVPLGIMDREGHLITKPLKARIEAGFKAIGEEAPRSAPSTRFPEGQIRYADEVLRALPCEGGKCDLENNVACENPLHILASIGQDKGELSKYVPHLREGVSKVINPRVTSCIASGRTSVSGFPYQQLPRRKGIRECLDPREGMRFVGADYSYQELVTLAQVLLWFFGESPLADVIQSGKDPHLQTGALLLGTTYEDAAKRKKDPDVKKHRQMAKPLNFGVPGGLGPARLVELAFNDYFVTMTEEEARSYKSSFLGWYPDVDSFLRYVGEECNAGGGTFTLTNPGSNRIRGQVGFCDGCNNHFQGLAADMTKRALWLATVECYTDRKSPLFGARPVLFVHDEIILEAPLERASEVGERLSALMVRAGSEVCPDVPIKANPWISPVWSKDVESMRDAQGKLIEWVPTK